MKKVMGILLVCTLLLGLMSMVSFADGASFSTSVPLLKVLADGANESVTVNADANGGANVSQSRAWVAWVAYYTDAAVDLNAGEGENLYLAFDLTIPTGGQVQVYLNGWNEPVATQMATACGKTAGIGEGGVAYLSEGTYTGAIQVNKSQVGENGRIGVVGTGITIRQYRLASAKSTPNVEEMSVDPGEVTSSTSGSSVLPETPSNVVVGKTLDLIGAISNGSNEEDTTEIKDEGNGFVISQSAAWNVWVLNYVEEAATFTPDSGDDLYLVYDLTVNGDGHLCLNGWTKSVAAAIAKVAGASTSSAEDGTPMLKSGTYTGIIKIDADTIGENGRLGIVGSGATIRKFQLAGGHEDASGSSEESRTTTSSETSGTSSVGVVGDADGDGELTMKDVLTVRKHIAGIATCPNAAGADFDGDKDITMKDVLGMRKAIAYGVDR